MRIDRLSGAILDEAVALFARSLVHDRVREVAREKLSATAPQVASDTQPAPSPTVLGAFDGARLIGAVAARGRFLRLLAVAPEARRGGVATRLLAEVHQPRMRVFDEPGNYLSPGVDVRYAEAHAFLAARGFKKTGEVENIRAPLDGNPLVTEARAAELAAKALAAGYRIERATWGDALSAWISSAFAPVWAIEAARAAQGPRRALHVAYVGEKPVAFAAADGNNQGLGWFGPAGTAPEHRGKGLGEALLIPCLLDVRGLPEGGVIAWIGPKPFYARGCGAVDDRRFTTWESP